MQSLANTKTVKQTSDRSLSQMNMAAPSAESIWNLPEKQFLEMLDSQSLVPEPRKIRFYTPSFLPYKSLNYSNTAAAGFSTISVTGNSCSLNCKHCQGKVLQTMHPATTPEKLDTLFAELKQEGATGCLVSGGCLSDGSVPLERFIPAISKAKRELGLTILVHTGIIDTKTARQLKAAEVDAALIDIIGATETILHAYNLNITTADYETSLGALKEAGLNVVPHVIVGLHGGKLKGELAALNMIAQHKPSAVVIIAFMPIHGTPMEKTTPPKPIDIARTVATARVLMPTAPLALGCMRPKGKHRQETDTLGIKAGINAIAYPTEAAIQHAQNSGYQTSFSPICCAQIHKDAPQ